LGGHAISSVGAGDDDLIMKHRRFKAVVRFTVSSKSFETEEEA
jgi:hypothetical protein